MTHTVMNISIGYVLIWGLLAYLARTLLLYWNIDWNSNYFLNVHFNNLIVFFLFFYMWEGPGSQPQSTLSCWKKPPTVNNKFWPLLNLVPKNRVGHSFQNCCDTKWNGLVVRWLFVSTNGIKMQILGLVGFKSSTLTVYCFSSWLVH